MSQQSPFGSGIGFAVLSSTGGIPSGVLPEEERLVPPHAIPSARTAFLLGRACAHEALSQLGASPAVPILRGSRREPLWPPGYCGSIAHTTAVATVAAAVAGRSSELIAAGIDIEFAHRMLAPGLLSRIASPDEIAWANGGGTAPHEVTARTLTLFAAKEAIYKAVAPFVKRYVGFKEVVVAENSRDSFTAQLSFDPLLPKRDLRALPVTRLSYGDYIVCACIVR